MNLYIWKRLLDVTDNYHTAAGLVVVADNEAEAFEKIKFAGTPPFPAPPPDAVFALADALPLEITETVFTFPDAGCC